MSHGGQLDDRIEIQRATVAPNDLGEPVETWATLATIWAAKSDVSAAEAYRAQEVGAQITTRFLVRYSLVTVSVNATDRIAFRGRLFNVTGVRERSGTRNSWLEIDAVARDDVPMVVDGSP